MADKIKGITVQIGGDTSGLSKALKGINTEIKGTQNNLKEVNKLLKLDPTNTNLLKEKQKLLGKQIEDTKNKLNALKQAQAEAKTMLTNGEIGEQEYKDLATQIDKCERALSKLEQEAKDTESKLKPSADKLATGFKNAGDKITAAGRKFAPFSAAATAGLAAGVKAAADWETAFTGVKKTVEATEEQYEELADAIQDMATRTSSSAEDIAAVAEVAGQLGVSAEDLMDFVEVMVNLGDTTNVSATEAATALAQFTNITGSSKKDVDKLGSAIVALGNNFATDEASILAMSQRLAAAGTQAGLSETDILALATAMSSVGIEAEAGGTAMTQTMTQIEQIVSGTATDSEEKLNTLASVAGTDAETFANAWKNEPITALEMFMTGLGNLDPEVESTAQVLDGLGMSGVRQSNMLGSLALASDTLTGAIQTASTAYEENTALTNEATKKYETFESKVSQTKEAAKQVAVEIGQALIPILKDMLEKVKDAATWFKNLDDRTKKTIVTVVGIVAAVTPVLTVLGKLTKGIGNVITAGKKLATLLGGLAAPIAGVAAGIAVLVTAIISNKKHLEELRRKHAELSESEKKLQEKINAERDAWAELDKTRKDGFQTIQNETQYSKDLWDKLQSLVDAYGNVKTGKEEEAALIAGELGKQLGIEIELVNDQIQGYKDLRDAVDKAIERKEAEALLKADEEAYTTALKNRREAANNVATAEYDVMQQEQKVKEAEEALKQAIEDSNQATRVAYDDRGTTAQATQDWEDKIIALQEALAGEQEHLETLQGNYKTAQDTLIAYDTTIENHNALLEAAETGTGDLEDAVENLTTGFITAKTGTAEALAEQTQTLTEEYKKQRDVVDAKGGEVATEAANKMESLVAKSIEELKKLDPKLAAEMASEVATINKNSSSWKRAGETNAQSYVNGVKSNIGLSVEERIKAALDLKDKAYKWGEDMMKNYAKGIDNNKYRPYTKAKEAADDVHRVLGFSEPEEGPLSDFHTYGPDMMKMLAQGISDNSWMVLQAAQGVASSLRGMLEGTTVTAKLDQTSVPIGSGLTLNIANFNNYSDSDIRDLTNEIMETAASFAARKGAVYA